MFQELLDTFLLPFNSKISAQDVIFLEFEVVPLLGLLLEYLYLFNLVTLGSNLANSLVFNIALHFG